MWMSGTASFRLRWPLCHVSHLSPMMIMFFRVGHSLRYRFTQVLQPILSPMAKLSILHHTCTTPMLVPYCCKKNQVIGAGAHAHAHPYPCRRGAQARPYRYYSAVYSGQIMHLSMSCPTYPKSGQGGGI